MASCAFLEVTKEIRLSIYAHYFSSFQAFEHGPSEQIGQRWSRRLTHDFALLRACKQIYDEAIEIFNEVYPFPAFLDNRVLIYHDPNPLRLHFKTCAFAFTDRRRQSDIARLAQLLTSTRHVVPLIPFAPCYRVGPYHLWTCFVEALKQAIANRPGYHKLHFPFDLNYNSQDDGLNLANFVSRLYPFERLRNVLSVEVEVLERERGKRSDQTGVTECKPMHQYADYVVQVLRGNEASPASHPWPNMAARMKEWEDVYAQYCKIRPYDEQIKVVNTATHANIFGAWAVNACTGSTKPLDVERLMKWCALGEPMLES